METKYITIPFDLERAKRITNGEEEGKIVTRNGRKARILCFDAHSDDNIVALIKDEKGVEFAKSYPSDGSVFLKGGFDCDLMLSVPEYRDGDILIGELGNPFIFNGKNDGEGRYGCYCGLDFKDNIVLYTNNNTWTDYARRYASKEEIEKIKEKLEESDNPLAKEFLKRFLDIEIKGCNFEPKDWVLTRESSEDVWKLDIFSHVQWEESEGCYHYYCVGGWNYECIPYNDQTKHLIGTTDNWDEYPDIPKSGYIKTSMIDVDKLKEENKR